MNSRLAASRYDDNGMRKVQKDCSVDQHANAMRNGRWQWEREVMGGGSSTAIALA